jgi:hypothetical protein
MRSRQIFLKRAGLPLLLVVFCWAGSQQAVAQAWVPLVGIQKQTWYTLSPAGKQLRSESEGVFMRNVDGSIYSRNQPVFGLPPGAQFPARMQDARTGIVYVINYAQKTAVPMTELGHPSPLRIPIKPPVSPDAVPLGKKVIAGVQCVGYRLQTSSPGDLQEIWLAPSLNYLAVAGRIVIASQKEEHDFEMVSIEPGKQPDPRYFQLPGDPKGGPESR